MGVPLFAHNQAAYSAALAMLEEHGRAAIIHPTGTGKSFIAFALAADHPDKAVCWLSPSEHIFRTQLENWEKACGHGGVADGHKKPDHGCAAGAKDGERPGNIRFLTYARLMTMDPEELLELKPDYIILDEFHRCGAKMWGRGVQRLLARHPDAQALGLSATSIRYLDGQRDMADELFGGNVASELTLGEAIVRGILSPPKYVLSLYAWQKELDKCRERVENAKTKAVRTEAEKYLEALRRALEKADGLDVVFQKHMEEKDGKYLVFCADCGHMQEMMGKAREWFAKVDPEPHMYSVYSEDPQSEQSFREFKADTSGHLKLLFCIDMLNEGVHVDGISGVVLLRPTVSPVIYKQQIGRALAAGKTGNAVIFDVVMNIENLYSIGTLEEEMQAAVAYHRAHGPSGQIVNEHFRVIDEVRDCMALFGRLNETLGASWDLMHHVAQRYFEEHGSLEAPKRYVTADGYSLGQWLDTQRKVRAGKAPGSLSDSQVARLDRLGMRWQGRADAAWDRHFSAAQGYRREHGHLLVGEKEEYGGIKLGKWIAKLRNSRESLKPGQAEKLEEIGMVWDVPGYRWERNFCAARRYYEEHGDLDVPYYYTDRDGVKLGAWICGMRSVRQGKDGRRARLTESQIRRLDEIGMVWEGRRDASWERSYLAACRYRDEHGSLDIPTAYTTADGLRLGRWIRRQRDSCRGDIDAERRKKLELLGL